MSDVTMPVVDPVCGMTVDADEAVRVTHGGTVYYFCEAACAEIFRDDPERWIEGRGAEPLRHSH